MHAIFRAFWLPKAGNSPSDYEDAFWPNGEKDRVSFPIRLSIGDGATETSFSAQWAKLLTQDYGEGSLTEDTLAERLNLLRGRWFDALTKEPLPWYAEEKLRSGAFSSIIGLTIEHDPEVKDCGGNWRALAIGDSCMFHIRDDRLIDAFPLNKTEQFDNRPVLVPSVSLKEESLREATKVTQGSWEAGDVFYLMTDALACWFLRRLDLPDGDPFGFLNTLYNAADFENLIRTQRSDYTPDGVSMLKNDDVTLLECRINHSE